MDFLFKGIGNRVTVLSCDIDQRIEEDGEKKILKQGDTQYIPSSV
jgi:hypothetical protein